MDGWCGVGTLIGFELFVFGVGGGREAERTELEMAVYAPLIPFFCVCFQLAVGEQLLKSQSTDPFLNLEIDAGVSNVQRSQSWLGNIGPAHQEIDTASSHGPQMQDAFLSPLSNKGRYHFKS